MAQFDPDDVVGATGAVNPVIRKSVDHTAFEVSDFEAQRRASVWTVHKIPEGTEAPTAEERHTLRKVAGSIPAVAFTLCFVEMAERASYYGVKGVFNNYLQFPLPADGDGSGAINGNNPNDHAGALDQGVQFASAMTTVFLFLSYALPVFGAWLADWRLGRFKAIMLGVIVGGIAHVIMIGGAAPSLLVAGQGLAPFMISLFLLAIGAGLFKPCVAPLLIDQYEYQEQYIRVEKNGERVIVDPEVTVQRILLWFYAFINVGGFFGIATTYIEKYKGFWLAYLAPGIVYFILPVGLLLILKKLHRRPPVGSEIGTFFRVIGTAIKQNGFKPWGKNYFDKAKPSYLAEKGINVPWNDKFVRDVARTLVACQIFLYFPIYNINDGGIGAVPSNQGAAMITDGAPNDLLNNFNPLVIIIFTPFLSHVFYPYLNKKGWKFGRIDRMTFGFLLAAFSGVAGAVVQYYVYTTSPCGYNASDCTDADGNTLTSTISIWLQLPNVIPGAISELFCNVTAYELAYARSPPNMKSLVMALFLFTNALSALLSLILVPAINDPTLVWAWAAPAIALFVQTAIFHWRHRGLNEDEWMLSNVDEEDHLAHQHATPQHVEKPLETDSQDFAANKEKL